VIAETKVGTLPKPKVSTSIGRNTLFGVVASLVQIGTRLITVPVVISHLGLGGYGIWNILLTIMGYMRFGSVGIKSAFQKYVAEATGNGSYELASKLLSTGTVGIASLSIILLTPVCIFSRQIAAVSGIPVNFLISSSIAISMLAVMMVLSNSASAFEAIIMGGHRIDLTRKMGTLLCVLEAAFILLALRRGYGLAAMAGVMVLSQAIYVVFCYLMSKRVVPEISVKIGHVTRTTVAELIRYAGSYQLVSVLQLTYGAVAPIAILKAYGAEPSGVYAIATRLVSPVTLCLYAFLVPILSGGAMVYATGSSEKFDALLAKSFKFTLAITLLPLVFLCGFGTDLIKAWTGQDNSAFGITLFFVSAATIANCFGLLGLVLYRASGRTVMDNLREVIRILILLPVVVLANKLGFAGVLAGIAVAEIAGAAFMFYALKTTFPLFKIRPVMGNLFRMSVATLILVCASLALSRLVHFDSLSLRTAAFARLGVAGLVLGVLIYPTMLYTKSITRGEIASILDAFRRKASAAN
jgi:O-antigen/teichoic acid export membrane protein